MDTRYRCHFCGYETTDKGEYITPSGDGTHHWVQFSCPQCQMTPPPVAEVGEKSAYKDPRWSVEETNQGVHIKAYTPEGSSSSGPIIPSHPLCKAPASLLRAGLEGSVADHHRWLRKRGDVRREAFRVDAERIQTEIEEKGSGYVGSNHPLAKERETRMGVARQKHKVGPHDDRVEHDGPTLMRRLTKNTS